MNHDQVRAKHIQNKNRNYDYVPMYIERPTELTGYTPVWESQAMMEETI